MRILTYKIIITGLPLFMALAVLVAPGSKAEKTFPSAPNTSTPTQNQTPWPTATKCSTSRWLAEGNASDSMGLNPGVLKNGAAFGAGAVGAAFRLDGINDYVEVPINIVAMNNPGSLGSFT